MSTPLLDGIDKTDKQCTFYNEMLQKDPFLGTLKCVGQKDFSFKAKGRTSLIPVNVNETLSSAVAFIIVSIMSRKQQSLSLETKQKILNEVDDKSLKKTKIAAKYGIASSTLSTILKNRDKIEAAYAVNQFEPARKRMRAGKNEDVEVALLRWIREARSQNIILTGTILQEKAKFFGEALGVGDFMCSNGWLSRFKERHGIVCKRICGEEAAVDPDIVESFFAEKWPALKKEFSPRNIFNADETGLFFKALPSRTLAMKGEKCSGGKCSKERITVMVACNMDGSEKIPLLVIGKSAKPRCFKKLQTLPVDYAFSKKAWMNSEIFTKWLTNLDLKFHREKRKICLILDNCAAHVEVKGLKAIKCVFLPPNTTAKIQPCDQGIIKCLKMHYRKEMVRKAIECFDSRCEFSINLLDAMWYLRSAWNRVKRTTMQNCFRHGGFEEGSEETIEEEQDEATTDSVVEEAEKRGIVTAALFEEYVNIDDKALTSDVTTDEDIISESKKEDVNLIETDDEGDDLEPQSLVTVNEAAAALKTMQQFLMQQENASCALNNLEKVDMFFKGCQFKKLKQKSITDFLKK